MRGIPCFALLENLFLHLMITHRNRPHPKVPFVSEKCY